MKKIHVTFYSYRPRIKVGLNWTTDLIPNVGDEMRIPNEFISQLDKKYFPQWQKFCPMTFTVKKRVWDLVEKKQPWQNYDVRIELDWTKEELVHIEKYNQDFKNKQNKKKKKGKVTN